MRTSKFTGDGLRVLTGSDDKTVKVWDLATATSLFTLNDATDYVRSQSASPAAHHVWMTGSSDRKARLYDLRSRNCIFVLDHASQVDDVHILPGGARAVTIGGPDVKLWDFFAGGKVSKKLTCHAKAVTCGAVNTEHGYFATGGLDGFLKVHDISTLETKGVLSFPSQILSIDISKDGQRFAAGMESGALEIRASEKTASRVGTGRSLHPFKEREFEGWGRGFARVDEDSSKPFPGSARYFNRGKGEKPMDDTDVIIERSSMLKLADHDKHLKQFSFGRALDAAVCTKKPKVVVAIVEELIIRGNLRGALSCRSLKELLPIMGVIKRNIRNPVYSDRLTYLMNIILDMYAEQFGVDEEADKLLKEILMQVKKEVKTGRDMSVLRGAAESVVTVSNMS